MRLPTRRVTCDTGGMQNISSSRKHLVDFRLEVYASFTFRAAALFELVDALLLAGRYAYGSQIAITASCDSAMPPRIFNPASTVDQRAGDTVKLVGCRSQAAFCETVAAAPVDAAAGRKFQRGTRKPRAANAA